MNIKEVRHSSRYATNMYHDLRCPRPVQGPEIITLMSKADRKPALVEFTSGEQRCTINKMHT